MIEDPPLLTVRRRFPRPSPEQVAALRGAPTGNVVDARDGLGALAAAVKPILAAHQSFIGVAITCHCGPGDNLAAFGALEAAEKGDVVVAAADGYIGVAVIGDLMLGMMKNRGIAAFVTDGAVRDIPGLEGVGLPCFAAAVTPNSPVRNGPGTVGQPIIVGGVRVESGDIVIGDRDGVVVVPRAEIDRVIERLALIRAAEAALEAKVKAGLEMPDFIKSIYAAGRIREID